MQHRFLHQLTGSAPTVDLSALNPHCLKGSESHRGIVSNHIMHMVFENFIELSEQRNRSVKIIGRL